MNQVIFLLFNDGISLIGEVFSTVEYVIGLGTSKVGFAFSNSYSSESIKSTEFKVGNGVKLFSRSS